MHELVCMLAISLAHVSWMCASTTIGWVCIFCVYISRRSRKLVDESEYARLTQLKYGLSNDK